MKRSGPGASNDRGAAKRRAKPQGSKATDHAGGDCLVASDKEAGAAAAASLDKDAAAPESRHHPSGKNAKTDKTLARASNQKQAPGDNNNHNVKVSYPNPRNFAERLMGALELSIAPDMVWWVGDGKAVALHQKRLKKRANQIQARFHVKDYSALIRNFNRWGFHRVSYYVDSVSEGVVTYQNCLFQKSQPHLVKHMRMDSDVQDVFERHQLLEESKTLAVAGSFNNGDMPSAMPSEQMDNLDQKLPAGGNFNGSIPQNQLLTHNDLNGTTTTAHQNNTAGVPGPVSSPQSVDQKALLSSLLSSFLLRNGQASNPSSSSSQQQFVSASQPPVPAQPTQAAPPSLQQATQNNANQPDAASALKAILQLIQNGGNNSQQGQHPQAPLQPTLNNGSNSNSNAAGNMMGHNPQPQPHPSGNHFAVQQSLKPAPHNSMHLPPLQNQRLSSQLQHSGPESSNLMNNNNPQRQPAPNAAALAALVQTYLQQAQQQQSQPPQQQGHPSQLVNSLVQGVQQPQRGGSRSQPPQHPQGHRPPSQFVNPLVQQHQRGGRSPPPPQASELQEMVRRMLQEQKQRPKGGGPK